MINYLIISLFPDAIAYKTEQLSQENDDIWTPLYDSLSGIAFWLAPVVVLGVIVVVSNVNFPTITPHYTDEFSDHAISVQTKSPTT